MKKIIALVGISGSGKSTLAHKLWLKDPLNRTIISRDAIRMLSFGFNESNLAVYYEFENQRELEKEVTKLEDTLIYEALESNKTVILDNTHLQSKYIDRLKYWNVPVEFVIVDTQVDTAVIQDFNRAKRVGLNVISKQYESFKKLISNKKEVLEQGFSPVKFTNDILITPDKAVIFDIDGTLAEKGSRSPFDMTRVSEDRLKVNVFYILDYLQKLNDIERPRIIICSGRDTTSLEGTKQWFKKFGIIPDQILMRSEGDNRADWVVKEEMWRHISKKYYILGMFDDRLQVVRRARSLGLTVFHVEYNNF